MKKTLSVILAALMLLTALPFATVPAGAETYENFEYEILDDDAVQIKRYYGKETDLEIFPEIDGKAVTSIRNFAFDDCTFLTSITIPAGVTSIGEYAFSDCTGLTEINVSADNTTYSSINGVLFNKDETELIYYPEGKTDSSYSIPSGVTSIGNMAFSGCTGLASIGLPNSVTSIAYYAFSGCESLTGVTIPNSVTSIGEGAFNDCTSLESIEIPDNVTSMGSYVFNNCANLANIKIGNSVTSIGDSAFSDCTSLTSITIPASVTSIGNQAFEYCTGLSSITIPAGVTSIGEYTFSNCTGLTEINVSADNKIYSSIDGVLFNKDKTELIRYPEGKTDTSYSIPFGVKSIGEYAFVRCDKLVSIEIPDSMASIGYGAFCDCTGLESIEIPDSVTSIESSVFYNTAYYNNENNWKDDVLYIGNHLIQANPSTYNDETEEYNNSGIQGAYTIKPGTKTIAANAFRNCTGLTSIEIPSGMTSIGYEAFCGCTDLESIIIPASVISIGKYAFSYYEYWKLCPLKDLTIYGKGGSYAQTYAQENDLTFKVMKSAVQPGNVNGDGEINATDATLVLQYFAKIITDSELNFDTAAADVNNYGEINATDATLILQYFAKIITKF